MVQADYPVGIREYAVDPSAGVNRPSKSKSDMGVWMSLGVDDVDQMHKHCVAAGLEVTFPPNIGALDVEPTLNSPD